MSIKKKAEELKKCVSSWEPEVKVLGNVTAKDVLEVAQFCIDNSQSYCRHDGLYTLLEDGRCCKCKLFPEPKEEKVCECDKPDPYFSRVIPMGYYCSNCGYKSLPNPE